MPELENMPERSEKRLSELHSFTRGLSSDEAVAMRCYLLGSLAAMVSDADWDRALATSVELSVVLDQSKDSRL